MIQLALSARSIVLNINDPKAISFRAGEINSIILNLQIILHCHIIHELVYTIIITIFCWDFLPIK